MLLDSILIVLATWRIAHMIVYLEDGPWDILHKLRAWVGVKYDDQSQPYGTNVVSKGMLCMWCFTVWLGIGFTILYYLLPGVAVAIALPFAISAGALWLDNMIK